jgi:hypothetical protein
MQKMTTLADLKADMEMKRNLHYIASKAYDDARHNYEDAVRQAEFEKQTACDHSKTRTANERYFEGSGFYDEEQVVCLKCRKVLSRKYTNVVMDSSQYR